MPVQTIYTLPSHTTTSGTDLDEYFPSGGLWINTKGASSVALITHRTVETGTCTLTAFAEFLYEPTNVGYPLLDMNNATAVSGVEYGNGTLDTSTPFYQLLLLREAPVEIDADSVKIINTIHKAYQMWIPEKIRFRFRSGGTTVTNTFSAQVYLHTAKAW